MLNYSSVTTVYPIEDFGRKSNVSEDTTTETVGEIVSSTQSFSPTVAAIQNSLESLHRQETPTLLPFTPNNLPEVTLASADTPLEGLLEHTEGTAEEPTDVTLTLETITLRSHEGAVELEEHLTSGKMPSAWLSYIRTEHLNQDELKS